MTVPKCYNGNQVLNLCMLGNFSWFLLTFSDFFQNQHFQKKSFRNTIRVSNNLDSDQDRHSVGPDLGPNCLQRLSADDISPRLQGNSLPVKRQVKCSK